MLAIRGKAAEVTLERARELAEAACRDDFAEGCTAVGFYHAIVSRNREQATKYFERACQLGSTRACTSAQILND